MTNIRSGFGLRNLTQGQLISQFNKENFMNETQNLSHVFWIGGSPCSGKSSIAQKLAAKYGLQLYHTDALEARPTSPAQPMMHYLSSLNPNEQWLRPVPLQVATELEYCREEFTLALEDLKKMPDSPGIIVEGTALLPHCVVPLLTRSSQAIWLVPTAEFQRKHYPLRGDWPQEVVRPTSNPVQAFENWMERDVRYGRIVIKIARELEQQVIEVDGQQTLQENFRAVEEYLQLEKFAGESSKRA